MSNFVRGWYKNSEATQKALFDLGYGWVVGFSSSFKTDVSQEEVKHLDKSIVYTNTNGTLTYTDSLPLGTPEGTQIDNLSTTLTLERIQEALATFREMDVISGGAMPCSKDTRQDIYTGKDGFISVKGWVDKYLTKDKDAPKKLDKDLYLEIKKNLETVLSELGKLS